MTFDSESFREFMSSTQPLPLEAVLIRSGPAHSGIRPAQCAALGAGSELVVLVFEQDVEPGSDP